MMYSDFPLASDKILSQKNLKKQNCSKMKGKIPPGTDVRGRNRRSGISVADNKWNPTGICIKICNYVIFVSSMENVLNSDVLDVFLTELSRAGKTISLLSKMWKSLMILRGIAVKWQPAFDVNKHKIMHKGKNKPDCAILNMSFKLPLTIWG